MGELDPVAVLSPMVSGPVLVDNDVNWAARAEREDRRGTADDFVYLHLGEGLGCAVVADGDVVRGHGGLAGEIAHLVTVGPGGLPCHLTEVFARLGLRRPGTTAIDVDRLKAVSTRPRTGRHLRTVARAVSGVVAAAIALADPEQVVVGGPWGRDPRLLASPDGQPGGGSARRPAPYGDRRRTPGPPRRPDVRTGRAENPDRHPRLAPGGDSATPASIRTCRLVSRVWGSAGESIEGQSVAGMSAWVVMATFPGGMGPVTMGAHGGDG